MRLAQIRLAGFKSFVEPTTIPVPGQLVAVCGPNGCGKSNVIDAVRWVLGESSARQLRGESMQDVIFNGSDQRKPAQRASVELVFDNSLGRASGPWSQYAEIAIRRVLTRSGDSSYFINNQAVRRRDITDLFLGTGVGVRGYAVIEQGMISRIIEARPEELRLFLEEAAGVSRYKERRRETESRLADARDNLLRLDDIRQELTGQLDKLAGQAEVAERYLQLTAERQHHEQQLALVRLRDAEREQQRWFGEGQQAAIAFEQAVAGLRECESLLETLREQHFSASDQLHVEQGRLYEVNARLARLEQQLSHVRESRERLGRQIEQDKRELAAIVQHQDRARGEQATLVQERERLSEAVEATARDVRERQQQLPATEERFRSEQGRQQQVQQRLHEAQTRQERLRAALTHQTSQLQALQHREMKLRDELRQTHSPGGRDLETLQDEAAAAEAALLQQRADLEQAVVQVREARHDKEQLEQRAAAARERESSVRARSEAIRSVLQARDSGARLAAWLTSQGWHEQPRLFEQIRIAAGWETAVESALGDVLAARLLEQAPELSALQAPGRVTLAWPVSAPAPWTCPPGLQPLLQHVEVPPRLQGLVATLLHGWCCAPAESVPADLPPGVRVVLSDGRLLCPGVVTLPGASGDGLLLQQAELQRLQDELQQATDERQQLQAAVRDSDVRLQQDSERRMLHERELKVRESRFQETRLALARQEELLRVLGARAGQINRDLEDIQLERETLALAREEHDMQLLEVQELTAALQAEQDDSRHERLEAEIALDAQRSALRNAEREWQEVQFQQRLLEQKLGELQRRSAQLAEQDDTLRERMQQAQLELELQDPMQFDEEIQAAIDARTSQERQLADARDALAHIANRLRQEEEGRHAAEQGIEPLRQRIQALQLKEQEARLQAEHQREVLGAIDYAPLLAALPDDVRPSGLSAAITRLGHAIDALGAVNLAAVEELQAARERKQWLDAQADDLEQAIATLTDAIARIDAETRERLLATYAQVNHNLGELFPRLFGGGRAELVLTGDEILDAGLQIIAQPPGKKNSTITLLSGGEKALTALSLVFALFRLNPAPFCLLDEVDAPLDDANTTRFCDLVKAMADQTQFLYISHNRLTMEMAEQLVGITMQEKGVSRMVAVDVQQALALAGV